MCAGCDPRGNAKSASALIGKQLSFPKYKQENQTTNELQEYDNVNQNTIVLTKIRLC